MDVVPIQGLTDKPNELCLNLELDFARLQAALLPILLSLPSLSSHKYSLITWLSGVSEPTVLLLGNPVIWT